MGEVIDMELNPQLRLDLDDTPESSQALEAFRGFEKLINGDPVAVIAAIEIFIAESDELNLKKSLKDILKETGSDASEENVIPAYGAWKTIERLGHYAFLDEFDNEVETVINQDQQMRKLKAERQNSRNSAESQKKIRAQRMQLYIGHVISSKTLDNIEETGEVGEIAESPDNRATAGSDAA